MKFDELRPGDLIVSSVWIHMMLHKKIERDFDGFDSGYYDITWLSSDSLGNSEVNSESYRVDDDVDVSHYWIVLKAK